MGLPPEVNLHFSSLGCFQEGLPGMVDKEPLALFLRGWCSAMVLLRLVFVVPGCL